MASVSMEKSASRVEMSIINRRYYSNILNMKGRIKNHPISSIKFDLFYILEHGNLGSFTLPLSS